MAGARQQAKSSVNRIVHVRRGGAFSPPLINFVNVKGAKKPDDQQGIVLNSAHLRQMGMNQATTHEFNQKSKLRQRKLAAELAAE